MWVFPMVELLVLPRFTDGKTEAWRGSVSQNQACGSQATVAPGGWGEESPKDGGGGGRGGSGRRLHPRPLPRCLLVGGAVLQEQVFPRAARPARAGVPEQHLRAQARAVW